MQRKIGILAIQGSIIEHEKILQKLNEDYILVRTKEDLDSLTHLIIPGGESTTMEKLLREYDMWNFLSKKLNTPRASAYSESGKLKVFGTCAGAILLQKFGMDIEIERNGYGAQLSSFSTYAQSKLFPDLWCVFIRAPKFTSYGSSAIVLATYNNEPVLLEQDNILVSSFHPELSDEVRIHEYFLDH